VQHKFIGLVEPIFGRASAHDAATRLLKPGTGWREVVDLFRRVATARFENLEQRQQPDYQKSGTALSVKT
jgi:hypothetical protein